MIKHSFKFVALGTLFLMSAAFAQEPRQKKEPSPRYTDPEKVDDDYKFQGEYTGELGNEDGKSKIGVQIIANGNGKFTAVVLGGGLPGDGFNGDRIAVSYEGELTKNGTVLFDGDMGVGEIKDGVINVMNANGVDIGTLKRVERESKTLGKKPPSGAIVLFDGTNADPWAKGRISEDGLLMPGTTSTRKFGDHQIHVEFRLPYMPNDKGQARGNSGIYLQGRYEVQMLDSFGLEGKNNECGGIYSVKDCDVNMCFPPLSWQTFDIEFTAAKYEGEEDDSKLLAPARMTVYHNGVKIHDNVELPGDRGTTASPVKPGADKGPVYLQNHGCPVRYRNIWVVEK